MTLAELAQECPALAEHVKANVDTDPSAAAWAARQLAYDLLHLADGIAATKRDGMQPCG